MQLTCRSFWNDCHGSPTPVARHANPAILGYMAEGPVTPILALGTSSSEQSLKSPLGHVMAHGGALRALCLWGLLF